MGLQMSMIWFKNFLGFKQSEQAMLTMPNPSGEFCLHVTLRSMQTGALLGSVLGPLSLLIFRDQRAKSKTFVDAFVSGGTNGALLGAAMGPLVTYASLRNMNTVQLYDKCYRLRFDQQQLWRDRTCALSAAVGYLSSGTVGLVVGLDLALLMSSLMGGSW